MRKHRICIIGNSHIAPIMTGVELITIPEDVEFDYFAGHSDVLRDMALRDNKLVPTTEVTRRRMAKLSAGRQEIEIADYSAFVLVGLRFNIVRIIEELFKYQIHGFDTAHNVTKPYLSRACLKALVMSILRYSTAGHYVSMLRKVTDRRITLIPQPYPSERIVKGEQAMLWQEVSENGLHAHVAQLYESLAQQLAGESKYEYMPQPLVTRSGAFTQQRFSQDATALSPDMNPHKKYPPSDPYHMNKLYGAIVLEQFLKTHLDRE